MFGLVFINLSWSGSYKTLLKNAIEHNWYDIDMIVLIINITFFCTGNWGGTASTLYLLNYQCNSMSLAWLGPKCFWILSPCRSLVPIYKYNFFKYILTNFSIPNLLNIFTRYNFIRTYIYMLWLNIKISKLN